MGSVGLRIFITITVCMGGGQRVLLDDNYRGVWRGVNIKI